MAPDNSYIPSVGSFRELSYAGSDVGIPAATALAASATATGNLMNSLGAKTVEVSATASQAGNLVLTGYMDAAGTVAAFTVTTAIAAGATGTAISPAGTPFATWQAKITNTSALAGTCGVNAALAQN